MARLETLNRRSGLRAHLPRTSRGGSLLEVDAWIPSEVKAISPLVDRLMRLIEGSHCIIGEEHDVELALREALSNAVVHGNREDARKLVHVRCRCKVGSGISLVVSDQGQGFDASAIPDSVSVENFAAEHGRGIQLMKWAMDEVSFKQRGTEVHMCKRLARNPRVGPQSESCGSLQRVQQGSLSSQPVTWFGSKRRDRPVSTGPDFSHRVRGPKRGLSWSIENTQKEKGL